jgi:hypothetical protein
MSKINIPEKYHPWIRNTNIQYSKTNYEIRCYECDLDRQLQGMASQRLRVTSITKDDLRDSRFKNVIIRYKKQAEKGVYCIDDPENEIIVFDFIESMTSNDGKMVLRLMEVGVFGIRGYIFNPSSIWNGQPIYHSLNEGMNILEELRRKAIHYETAISLLKQELHTVEMNYVNCFKVPTKDRSIV